MTDNTIRLTIMAKAWLDLPDVENWETVEENLGEGTTGAAEDLSDLGDIGNASQCTVGPCGLAAIFQ